MINCPIYRAKKIDSDEWVDGFLQRDGIGYFTLTNYLPPVGYRYENIDPSTLAINFPDMLDSEGTKIFASLSEDGKGGSRVVCDINHQRKEDIEGVLKYKLSNWFIDDGSFFYYFGSASNIKVVGIKK